MLGGQGDIQAYNKRQVVFPILNEVQTVKVSQETS